MRWISMLCTALLAGCSTPGETVKAGESFDYRTSKAAPAVAGCIKRNADEPGAGTSAQTRINIDGDPEIVVRKTADGSIMAVVQIVADRGTRVNASITQYGTSAASVANALVNDCL